MRFGDLKARHKNTGWSELWSKWMHGALAAPAHREFDKLLIALLVRLKTD